MMFCANFTITIAVYKRNNLAITEDDLTSGIFIDTISPNITLAVLQITM